MKYLNRFVVVICALALAVPTAVLAKGPGDNGKSGQPHGNTNHVSKRCKHQPKVGFVLGGTLDATSTATDIIVDVTHANKHSKPFVTDNKFDVGADSSKATFVGSNPFTTQGADLTKYKVKVIGKVVKLKKGCTADNSPAPTIRKVTVIAPDASTEQPEQEGAQSA